MTFTRGTYSLNPIQHCFYMRGEFGFAQIYRRGNKYFIHWIEKRKTERIKKTKVVELFNSEQRIDDETYLKIKKKGQNMTGFYIKERPDGERVFVCKCCGHKNDVPICEYCGNGSKEETGANNET